MKEKVGVNFTTMHNKALALMKFVLFSSLVLLLSVACGPSTPEATSTPVAPESTATAEPQSGATPVEETGYPGPDIGGESAYPGPAAGETGSASPGYPVEGVQPEPPDPERELPDAGGENGVIGGVLVREITDQGYLPVTPRSLLLADVIYSDEGEAAFIRQSSDSPQAELFQTGVFVFEEVVPGSYGLVADMGFGQLPVLDAEGATLSFEVEAGEALDLGQVFVQVPGD